ncbi:hypothetical protein CQA53_08255 [Helicobacter didelphidarum]|uniref:Type I restriction modification DNA specificity domain-containing protein n=1 Tax=Helicobacter didelphidarum TaxID=2040648 RepID=A0A3D8IER2_9HELI|nr:restriction endonuclease subunit S [Helicobacter didelphidarum]RDU63600.1 hypothetical protein CQA53_08255 [Helicobacter didelphidarum]
MENKNIRDWKIYELNEILEIKSNKFNPLKDSNNLKCIELEHISQETGVLLGYIDSNSQLSIKNQFRKGEILFGKLRPYLKKYWKAEFDGVCSSEIWVFNGKKAINDFLFYFIQTNKFTQIANISTGTKMPRADWQYMKEIPFYIPPPNEQEKIAEILSTVDEGINALERLIALKEQYKKGVMQRLFTPPTNTPHLAPPLAGGVGEGDTPCVERESISENVDFLALQECDKMGVDCHADKSARNDNEKSHHTDLEQSKREISATAAIASEAKQTASFVIARNEMTKQSTNESFKEDSLSRTINMDCHESTCVDSRNDDEKNKTHNAIAQSGTIKPLRFKGFTDKWQSVRLGEVLKECNLRNRDLSISLVLSITNSLGFVRQKDYFERELASDDISKYKIICKGNFAYNPARINVGSIALLREFDKGVLSPMYIIFKCAESINNIFLNYWIHNHHFKREMANLLEGSVRQVLSFSAMCEIKIKLPSLKEQEKIANFLSLIDDEIQELKNLLQLRKTQKQGLMQQLLSGKVRVRV